MGEYFLVSNPAKRQYFEAGLGEYRNKIHGLPGEFEARAVVLLACRASFTAELPFAGTWAQDPFLVVGDQETPDPPFEEAPLPVGKEQRFYEANSYFASLDAAVLGAIRGISRGWEPIPGACTSAPPVAPTDAPIARAAFARGHELVIVNTRKAELLTPGAFCVSGDVMGPTCANAAMALAFLVCRAKRLDSFDLAQSWAGDPIVLLRRNADDPREAARTEDACATCEDVSLRAMAMLARADDDHVEALVTRAVADERELILVGNVVRTVGSTPLAEGLEAHLGRAWVERYHRALTTVSASG
ncbi:hypothetical protein AKJ09_05069 [Labilithrix luteola]|uniref:Uncharacterized protein n=1 Tax=Labilithrix luteola TaxID=1391654 RepID=A0A0K1PXZ8_9BACT|nr:hypothetical protein [Labilithrix luteola]AKU98405.1 hypothetical protein AKJ09_05069 [Labilithrix luteola]